MGSGDDRYDAIVIGVGGMGSAATYHLAKRGHDVLALEQFDIPHQRGSYHGVTRIIRKAYFEDPAYVPLLHRAYELWEDLEADHERDLVHRVGSLTVGPTDGGPVGDAIEACEAYDLPYDLLGADRLGEEYPAFHLPGEYRALYQPEGGFLASTHCLTAHVQQAFAEGAEIRAREPVRRWAPTNRGVRVETDDGTYAADRLVVAAGAWANQVVDALGDRATPERQVLGWFQPREPADFSPENLPVFTAALDEGPYFGFPVYEAPGFKLGRYHHLEEDVDPDDYDREPRPEDERVLREVAERYFPSGAGETLRLATCLYTNSPDEQFIIDTHPDHEEVVVAAGFSGHGYKFCSVVGEILADLTENGRTDHPIDLFSIDRFDA